MSETDPQLYTPSSRETATLLREAVPGLTIRHARQLSAILGLRQLTEPAVPRIARPREVWNLLRAQLGTAKQEQLVGLYLDAQNGLIARLTISVGSLNTTRTHPREILAPALGVLALGFILAHNHPSGCLDPSDEDISFTRAVQRAGEVLGVELYDHIIVTRDGYTSLRERGAL